MKNHFILSYYGNKRNEAPKILENIDIKDFKTIIEPFCGSSAVSYYISTIYPKKYKYILNDNDTNLIKLYNILKNENEIDIFEKEINKLMEQITNKEEYLKIVKKNDFNGWIIANKIHYIHVGLYKVGYKYNKDKPFKVRDYPIYNFIKNEDIEIYNEDAIDIVNKYKDNKDNFIFIDPPYLMSCNDFYSNKLNVNIYEWMYKNNITKHDAFYCLILEENWIINILVENMKKILYDKKYDTKHKKTTHMLILSK
jgi:site-specific DNA-adenine methylase